MRKFVKPLDKETIYILKDRIIKNIGHADYYDLIGNRIEFIIDLKRIAYKDIIKALKFTHEVFGIEGIDEKRAFRLVLLNEADRVVRSSSKDKHEDFFARETALMELAYEVYLEM